MHAASNATRVAADSGARFSAIIASLLSLIQTRPALIPKTNGVRRDPKALETGASIKMTNQR